MIGRAAVAIWCDVALEVREEFNHWHAHEHMPERLALPGFLRGSRWVADEGTGYFILYETHSEAAITGPDYIARLNNPTPWSREMMPHHRNMIRGACRIEAGHGAGLGHALLSLRFSAQSGKADALSAWLRGTLAAMAKRKGVVATALLRHIGATRARLTTEQRLRGGDQPPDWVLLINGYSAGALEFSEAELTAHGALPGGVTGRYRLAYILTAYTPPAEETA